MKAIKLLQRIATIKRYDPNAARNWKRSTITLNVPVELLQEIDEYLKGVDTEATGILGQGGTLASIEAARENDEAYMKLTALSRKLIDFIDAEGPAAVQWMPISNVCEEITSLLDGDTAPPAASGQKLTEAIEALACPATNHCSRPELFEQGFECARSMAADLIRASSATARDKEK